MITKSRWRSSATDFLCYFGTPKTTRCGAGTLRVATAGGLALALSQQAPGSNPLQVYLVHYIAPKEAQRIESMVEDMKKEPQAEAGGAAAAGAPFVIVNERVLQAKDLALMAMRGEITDINTTMEEVRAKEQAPYYIAKTSLSLLLCYFADMIHLEQNYLLI